MTLVKISAAIAFSIAASSALADDQTILLAQTAPGVYGGSFSQTHLTSGALFDSFTFTLPGDASAMGSGSLSFTSLSGAASLVLATLTSADGSIVNSPLDADSVAIPSTLSFTGFTSPLVLAVVGIAGDAFADPVALTTTYAGRIDFSTAVAAVPEPQTYASMLAGLALLGLALGRNKARRQV